MGTKKSLPRVPMPPNELQNAFATQLRFLKDACVAFDSGDTDQYLRIALHVRVLLHDTLQSKSLAKLLDLKGGFFASYCINSSGRNLLSDHPLVLISLTDEGCTYVPVLNNGPFPAQFLLFSSWWSQVVFKSSNGLAMRRSDFVLITANQMGGAHVDSEVDEAFWKVSRENEVGWVASSGDGIEKPLLGIEKAYVRHIGFEVLESLTPALEKMLGNKLCECGSGRKFRYCHGRLSHNECN